MGLLNNCLLSANPDVLHPAIGRMRSLWYTIGDRRIRPVLYAGLVCPGRCCSTTLGRSAQVGLVKEVIDALEYLEPRLERLKSTMMDTLPRGVVSRKSLAGSKRLKGEVFAAELLARDIMIEAGDSGTVAVRIDRRDVRSAVISTEGKAALCAEHVSRHQESLARKDADIHAMLLGDGRLGGKRIDVKGLPMRWASGGVMSLVTYKGRQWVPLFFRDIRPYGWNISLGSSERYFDIKGQVTTNIDEELMTPTRFICREFLEETLVLAHAPREGENMQVPFIMPFGDCAAPQQKALQTSGKHLKLRERHDRLSIEPEGQRTIAAGEMGTKMRVSIEDGKGHTANLSGVLVCFNLLELGIEIVKTVSYGLADDDYILDGEVLERTPHELTRMPVALISLDYLREVFGGGPDTWRYTAGAQPSVESLRPISPNDATLFGWDIRQRMAIVKGIKEGVGTEFARYMDWYDKFRGNFLDDRDEPISSPENMSRLFTPATAKVLSLFFASEKNA
jgi:hypothetical protein